MSKNTSIYQIKNLFPCGSDEISTRKNWAPPTPKVNVPSRNEYVCSITRVRAPAGVKNELRFPIIIEYVKFRNIGAAGPPSYLKWTCPQIYLGYFSEHFQQKKKYSVNIFWTWKNFGSKSEHVLKYWFLRKFRSCWHPHEPPTPPMRL